MILKSLNFWTLLVGLIVYVVTFFVPTFPFNQMEVLSAVLFVLGLINIHPTFKFASLTWIDLFGKMDFWLALTGFVSFVVTYYKPDWGWTQGMLMSVVLAILALFKIKPELKYR